MLYVVRTAPAPDRRELVKGQSDPTTLAQVAKAGLKKKTAQLEQTLRGMVGLHQRLMLRHLLNHVDFLARQIGFLDREMAKRTRPFEAAIEMLDAIYGIGRRTAEDILAEIGVDMSRWPCHGHIASWAKICPGNHESAGKRHSGRTGKGNHWLRGILVEASMNVTRKPGSYYAALYHRIAARRGKKRAHVARPQPAGRHLPHAEGRHRAPRPGCRLLREA